MIFKHDLNYARHNWQKVEDLIAQGKKPPFLIQNSLRNEQFIAGLLRIFIIERASDLQSKLEFCKTHNLQLNMQKLLRSALDSNHVPCLQLVIQYLTAVTCGKSTQLMVPLLFEYEACAKLLIQHNGTTVNQVGQRGTTALMLANTRKMTQILLDAGANVHAMDLDGKSVLLRSVLAKHDVEVVRLLVKYGAKVTAGCIYHANYDLSLLQQLTMNATKGQWKSILQYSLRNGSLHLMKMALNQGARISTEKVIYLLQRASKSITLVAIEEFNLTPGLLRQHFAVVCKNETLRNHAKILLHEYDMQGKSALYYFVQRKIPLEVVVFPKRFFDLLEECGMLGALYIMYIRNMNIRSYPLVFSTYRVYSHMHMYHKFVSVLLIYNVQFKPWRYICMPKDYNEEQQMKYLADTFACFGTIEPYKKFGQAKAFVLVRVLPFSKKYADVTFIF